LSKTRSISIVLLFLGIIAASFTGVSESGIHSECMDGIDNDNDAGVPFIYTDGNFQQQLSSLNGVDGEDAQCMEYPYADGNGENPTPPGEQYQRFTGYSSLFEYHEDHGSLTSICHGLRFSGEFTSGTPPIPTNDPWYDGEEVGLASLWVIQNSPMNAPHTSSLGCPQ